jgi:hypothetical protein
MSAAAGFIEEVRVELARMKRATSASLAGDECRPPFFDHSPKLFLKANVHMRGGATTAAW